MEDLNNQIESNVQNLSILRKQLSVLENDNFKTYSLHDAKEDPWLQYHKTKCLNTISKDKLLALVSKFITLNKSVESKRSKEEFSSQNLSKIQEKLVKTIKNLT